MSHNCLKKSFPFFRFENEERKKQLDEVSQWIKTENEKRMAEAEALKARLNIIYFKLKWLKSPHSKIERSFL
jgi:hypothetical protein